MNQKTLNVIYSLVIVVLIAAIAYFAMSKKSTQPNNQAPTTDQNNQALQTSYKDIKYKFEVKLPSGWRVSDDMKKYEPEAVLLTSLSSKEEMEKINELTKPDMEWEFSPGFCNIHYADGQRIIVKPTYLSNFNSFSDYFNEQNDRSKGPSPLQGHDNPYYNLKQITNPSVATVHQYNVAFGWEGCGEKGTETYLKYPKAITVNGKTATGIFVLMEDSPDGSFNSKLYSDFIDSFKFN